jgi:PDZ domain-containing protein
LVILALILAFFVSINIHVNYYSITPGQAESVAPNVKVVGLASDSHRDRIMLTDVYLNPLTAFTWFTTQFDSHAQIIPASVLLSPGASELELTEQGYIDMSNSKDFARLSALHALGWNVPVTGTGALVYAVGPNTPAAHAGLGIGDRIIAVNGTAVKSACDVIGITHYDPVGTAVAVTVRPATISNSGTITYGAAKTDHYKTAKVPRNQVASSCPHLGTLPHSISGLQLLDAFSFPLRDKISIATPSIGGPSAGLAMTLALIDRLSSGSLTGHLTIAATGTIDPFGNVGDVGGVAQKTVAVQNAGATVFIVPQVEVQTARTASNGTLRIIGVTTLKQVLRDLRRLGGQAPIALTKPYPLQPTT